MIMSIALVAVLMLVCVFIHYEALRGVSDWVPRMTVPPRSRLLVVILVAMLAHIVEIGLFAVAFWVMQTHLKLGALSGLVNGTFQDFIYFSASNYTTLGMGDLVPLGHMRIVAAMESLIGLLLIGWSTSFTYLVMREFWDLHGNKKRD